MYKFIIKITGDTPCWLGIDGKITTDKQMAQFFETEFEAEAAAASADVVTEFFEIHKIFRKNHTRGCGSHTTWCL